MGGGTHLPAQAGCLDICGVRGAAKGVGAHPGDNSRKLAQIVGGAVLAGSQAIYIHTYVKYTYIKYTYILLVL